MRSVHVAAFVACLGAPGCLLGPPAESATASALVDCHPRRTSTVTGAYFRKVTSLADAAHGGIVGELRLPMVDLDPSRTFATADPDLHWQNGPMDRPSVYLGGHAAGSEVDAGLTWDRVYHVDGRAAWTDAANGCDGGDPTRRFVVDDAGNVTDVLGTPRLAGLSGLVPDFAFRTFWRTRSWNNPAPTSGMNHYFWPNETIRMAIHVVARDELALYVHPEPSDGRDVAKSFRATGFGRGLPQSFKRVSSIDQFANVGGRRVGLETLRSEVLPTRSSAVAAVWREVTLLGLDRRPRSPLACDAPAVIGADARFASGGYDAVFTISEQTDAGGETIDIVPASAPH
jgi:hypothetical protein